MKKVNSLISERLKKGPSSPKMSSMAERSANGNLSSFSGMFSISDLSTGEKETLETLLNEFAESKADIQKDLKQLITITSEVKAINNQAAILHGERIKKAHTLLTGYKEGAFTAWLIQTYGNRQTPYNLMQYYDFYESLPLALRPKLEEMPRQAVYTLASREGELVRKIEIIENYTGQTKQVLLTLIRENFPLKEKDRRRQNLAESAMVSIKKVESIFLRIRSLGSLQKEELKERLLHLKRVLDDLKVRG